LHSLSTFNSFALPTKTKKMFIINCLDDIFHLANKLDKPFYILGEGSNTLFIDDEAPTILKIGLKGVAIKESKQFYYLTVAAGENWHDLVSYTIEENIYGLENLALIPGSVGAAPVQNIGAYGVEFADYCQAVSFFDFRLKKEISLSAFDCNFAYRDSIFKNNLKNKGVITSVTLAIPKSWQAKLNYTGLNTLDPTVTARDIFKKVISLRKAKLPDPYKLPNAGSFFKNPVVSKTHFIELEKLYGAMPNYTQAGEKVKLAAGWLIDRAGLKGYRDNQVGIHDQQALVLVNYAQASGKDLIKLACYVQKSVYDKFKVKIEPEVRLISTKGEVNLDDMCNG